MIDITQEQMRVVRDILQKHAPGVETWAFGSRVNGRPKKFSDLDLALITHKPLTIAALGVLQEAFSESDLPWRVDVVDWAAISPKFREIISACYEKIEMAAG